ncbi:MAG: hypothetical protein Alpg2KO_07750 [Alphaproteobacteria bacterium]
MAEKRLKRRSGGSSAAADKMAKGLTLEAARQTILSGAMFDLGSGCKGYWAGTDWQAGMLAEDETTAKARTMRELEAALQDPNCADVYIPRKSALTMEMIERAARQYGFGKVVFIEGDADNHL